MCFSALHRCVLQMDLIIYSKLLSLLDSYMETECVFSKLAPKQSVDKPRVDPCRKWNVKDSLGSRWFPSKWQLNWWRIEWVTVVSPCCFQWAGSQHRLFLVTFQVRLLCQDFPTWPVQDERATACTLLTEFRKQGTEGVLGAEVHGEALKVVEEKKVWGFPNNVDPSTCTGLKKKAL